VMDSSAGQTNWSNHKMTSPILAILIDALRHDFITDEATPFLFSLRTTRTFGSSMWGLLEEPFGFLPRLAIFAGLTPEESGYSAYYYHSASKSPFGCRGFMRLLPDWMLYHYLRVRCNLSWKLGLTEQLFAEVPRIRQATRAQLAVAERYPPWHKSMPEQSLFHRMRRHDRKWVYLGYPSTKQETELLKAEAVRQVNKAVSFYWLHFAETDWMQHAHGPDSWQRVDALKRIDDAIRTVYRQISSVHTAPPSLLAFGDHGAVQVTRHVDIQSEFRRRIRTAPFFYCDSTMLHAWSGTRPQSDDVSKVLRELEALGLGRLVDESMRHRYKIRFPDDKYGTHILVAHPGTLYVPNVFQGDRGVKGMHGHLPDDIDNRAAWQLTSTRLNQTGPVSQIQPMTSVYATLLDLLLLSSPKRGDHRAESLLRLSPDAK